MYKQQDIYQEAQLRVRRKAKFFKHFFIFVVMNGFFFTTALFQGDPFEPLVVTFFWGIGLVFHYLKVFGLPGSGVLSKDWEEREYRQELKRLESQQRPVHQVEEQLELKEMAKKYRDSDLV